MIDWFRQALEESVEDAASAASKAAEVSAWTSDAARSKRSGLRPPEDDVCALGACQSRCFESDTGATADYDDGLADEFRLALDSRETG